MNCLIELIELKSQAPHSPPSRALRASLAANARQPTPHAFAARAPPQIRLAAGPHTRTAVPATPRDPAGMSSRNLLQQPSQQPSQAPHARCSLEEMLAMVARHDHWVFDCDGAMCCTRAAAVSPHQRSADISHTRVVSTRPFRARRPLMRVPQARCGGATS
jgi:hypothetical protein